MKYQRTNTPTIDGHYFVRLPDSKTWHTGLLIGGETACPVFAGGVSGAAIPLDSLRGAEFAGPIPRPGQEPDLHREEAAWITIAGMIQNALEASGTMAIYEIPEMLKIALAFANRQKGGEA
jgi:hypothetical protein